MQTPRLEDWKYAVKTARRYRDHYNLPREVYECLAKMLARLEYVDNIRWARKWDGGAAEAYEKARDGGCCGSYDTEVETESGDVWLLGCNYGH
jgi:hypothetical protein